MKILVVDDEKLLVKGLRFNLENDGHEVDSAYDGVTAISMFSQNNYDLIILDLMLPGLSGLEVCRKIRESSTVPIIMLTAKSDGTDKIIGFEYGADDYLTKPFDILELKVRIRAIMRRVNAANKTSDDIVSFGHISINFSKRSVFVDKKEVDLTAKEFDLLAILVKNAGEIFSREDLLNSVWDYSSSTDIRTVDVHIRRLREKLEKDDANPQYILTKWGVGYYFGA